ncbi:MAG: hypothetical protein FJ028_10700 [Chloroflexi bacterium]|nr:hypothetical protein [Chloroflexota bacterium]
MSAQLAAPPPVLVTIDADRFDISAEGNVVTGLRLAPVPYRSMTAVASAVRRPAPVPAAVRVTRATPPQMIDYVWCVTEEGVLVVGQQIRTLDHASGHYDFTEGDIERAYPALEATVPWTWIVSIPLGREVALTLEVRAPEARWPVRAVTVTPTVSR